MIQGKAGKDWKYLKAAVFLHRASICLLPANNAIPHDV
jgi:hypothetical protein